MKTPVSPSSLLGAGNGLGEDIEQRTWGRQKAGEFQQHLIPASLFRLLAMREAEESLAMPKKQLWYLPVCGAVAAKEGYQTGLNMGLIMLCYQGFIATGLEEWWRILSSRP